MITLYKIHTFGGRELGINQRGNDLGWTQNPNLLVKFPRNVDICLNDSNILNIIGNGSVTRLKCKLPLTSEEIASFTNSYIKYYYQCCTYLRNSTDNFQSVSCQHLNFEIILGETN